MKLRVNFGNDRQIAYTICCAIFGYAISYLFVLFGVMGPKPEQEGFAFVLLLANFEARIFVYLVYFGPSAFGLGWAVIFILASYQKRLLTLSILSIMAITAYILTSRIIGHAITISDLIPPTFSSQKTVVLYLGFSIPLLFCLSILAFILFKPLKWIHEPVYRDLTSSPTQPPSPPPATPPESPPAPADSGPFPPASHSTPPADSTHVQSPPTGSRRPRSR